MTHFQNSVAAVLEVESPSLDDDFRDTRDWCSLKAFGLMVLLENDFSAPLTAAEFQKMRTLRDLARHVLKAAAARVFAIDARNIPDDLGYGDIPQWDSVNHLRLVMEVESVLGEKYPLERIPFLRTLDAFLL